MVDIVVLPMRLQTPSASPVLAQTLPLGSLCSVQCLAVYIRICIGPALEGPLRGQLYQAPVSKHFLASAIVSGFGVSRWDGSLGGSDGLSVSAPLFVPAFSFDRRNSGLIFLRWVDGPIPQLGAMPNLWILSPWVLSPLCWVFQLMSSSLGPGNLLHPWHLGLSSGYSQCPIPSAT